MSGKVERCGQLIEGVLGAETFCVRQRGHKPGHRETDGIYRELPDPDDPVPWVPTHADELAEAYRRGYEDARSELSR